MNTEQAIRMRTARGFVAALDQSGGSTPKALRLYGVDGTAYTGDAEMFDRIHELRARIITSSAFTAEHVLAAILFENTMDREIDGKGSAEYLWEVKGVVPILKVDKGLEAVADGARLMRPIPGLDALLARARSHGVFGTKMRSVILSADPVGVQAVVDQQFAVARRILDAGLLPIVEPEIDIHAPDKAEAEILLHAALRDALDALPADRTVMLKLTLPSRDDLYADLVAHPHVLRVAALSGGYSRAEANALLARNHGVVASFSRALTEGLRVDQTPEEFDRLLAESIRSIYAASIT